MATVLLHSLLAGTIGLLSHWFWFLHGEHDTYAGVYVKLCATLSGLLIASHALIGGYSLYAAILQTSSTFLSYFGALYLSIVVYRVWFSPVRHVPGPIALKISKLAHAWNIRRLDNYRFLKSLHESYGDVVRTGPNEVTFFTPEAFEKIYGHDSKCTKAAYYDSPSPITSLVNQRNLDVHQKWRKVWDQAFSWRTLSSYETTVYQQADKFIAWLDRLTGEPVEIGNEFERYTFDILGILGLGHEFNMLDGAQCRAYELYHRGQAVFGPIVTMPWFVSTISIIPRLYEGFYEQIRWIQSELKLRQNTKPKRKAVIDYVIEDVRENGDWAKEYLRLQGDFLLVMAAASDPMHKCLTDMAWYLAADTTRLEKIRDELDSLKSVRDYKSLMQLPYLNAIIYETMRLHPPVPAAGLRNIPPAGLEINGVFVPEGTVVLVPQHTLFRREDCFVRSQEFIPERWTTKPELILNRQAYQPWSSGRFACVGKHLGLMEIRIATALFVQHFDFAFAPGFARNEVFEKATDHFTASPGPLYVKLERRKA